MAEYAKVIVDISHEKLDRTFEYRIPEELCGKVREGMQVLIPFGPSSRKITGYVIELSDQAEYDPAKIKELLEIREDGIAIEGQLIRLAAWMKKSYGGTMNQALKTVLPVKKKIKAKEKKKVVLMLDRENALIALSMFDRKNNKARARLLSALLDEKEIPYELVTGKLNISTATLKKLEELRMIEIRSEQVYRMPLPKERQEGYQLKLNEEQKTVVEGIRQDMQKGDCRTFLLHGVTGSGKTEVYMELIAAAAEEGKQAIMLIPEIALTYQTVMRFYKRFGDRISILNSRMSQGERYDQYLRAKRGEIDVMIGPRSALFTPFANLGLIIIDEEHESSYQSENIPKYHARETAIERARLSGAFVLLGSATPSLESYHAAKEGSFHLYELKKRVYDRPLPEVEIVDLRKEMEAGNRSPISRSLHEELKKRLEREEQSILFLNRRGIAGFISCRSCGEVIKCPHCDVSLSSHKNGKLLCHYCGYEQPMVSVCPVCGSKTIGGFRAGTQKMEALIQREFPKARILRMDFDSTREKESYEKILSAFSNMEADILIGTQMIVKGHDFPNVTLVGVLAADLSLNIPEYTASEKTFQLLTQAAGRAGRGSRPGKVIIQTYQPDHFAIRDAAEQDYQKFYEEEIQYRQILKYPPIWHMMDITLSSASQQKAEQYAEKIRYLLAHTKAKPLENLTIIGPADAALAKVNDIYRKVIYIKGQDDDALIKVKDAIEKYDAANPQYADISIQFTFR